MMKTAQDIIIAPVITEASMAAIAQKKYTFRVMKKVNKQEIAAAVEELFGVKVAKVNTINDPAETPTLPRLKSITRYLVLLPPPR